MKRSGRLVLLLAGLVPLIACSDSSSEDESTERSNDAVSISNLFRLVRGTIDRSAPDPGNPWAHTELAVGEEYRLSGEDAEFAGYGRLMNRFQEAAKREAAEQEPARAFHAKSHACLLGRLAIDPSKLPQQARVGVFASAGTYPTWARFSNGLGSKQSDKKLDMRGFALKIMGVDGARIVTQPGDATATTQDFLLANQPIAPASDVRRMMAFGEAMSGSAESTTILGKAEGLLHAGAFLTRDENVRIVDFLANHVLERTNKVGSLLGDEYFTGAPNALGLEAGDPNVARARGAFKLMARTGVLRSDVCTPVAVAPNGRDPAFLRADIEKRLAEGPACADLYLQLQTNGLREPIEDVSVPWKSPFTKVGRIVFERQVLAEHAAEQAKCDAFSFSPWHTLEVHRPLGNVMRARRIALASSAAYRGATLDEPSP